MANQTINDLPALITSADGSAFTLNINNIQDSEQEGFQTVYIEVSAGTWTFSNNDSTVSGSATWTSTNPDKIVLTIKGGKLHCKAANISETFKISA